MEYVFGAYDYPSKPTRFHLYADCPVGAGKEVIPVDDQARKFYGELPTCQHCQNRMEREHDA